MRCLLPFFSVCAGPASDGAGADCLYRAGRVLGGGIAMIVMSQLTAGYDREPVTRPLSGVIECGSMTAILGANGCGKSTLLENPRRVYPAGKRPFSLAEKTPGNGLAGTASCPGGAISANRAGCGQHGLLA